jgi:hypothetical protein
MPAHADPARQQRRTTWQRQPVVWLGIVVFAASIAGCVWLITVGMRHADPPVATSHGSVFGVPATPHQAAKPAPATPPP